MFGDKPKHLLLKPVTVMVLLLAVFAAAGCSNMGSWSLSQLYKRESRPGRTKLPKNPTTVPAQLVTNYFIIEVSWDKRGPWRFIVDTGSSVTLMSPEYVRRYPASKNDSTTAKPVSVRSASGGVQKLPPANVSVIEIGDAQFLNVPVLVYDCSELSAHFGMKIDGVLGFPLFRDTVFTLDYPQSRLTIRRPGSGADATEVTGSVVQFNNETRAPIIPVRIGDQSFSALIDTGSDGALMLNPVGMEPEYTVPPRPGAVVGTMTGDRLQEIGRLAQPLSIGTYILPTPVADITDQLSSLGGAVLKNFRITFDPSQNQVIFSRESFDPVVLGVQRSAGLSFIKTPAYWRVVSVTPGSPAESVGVQVGDIVSRIDGEPVADWTLQRYDSLVKRAEEVTYTFVNGSRETPLVVGVFDLVP